MTQKINPSVEKIFAEVREKLTTSNLSFSEAKEIIRGLEVVIDSIKLNIAKPTAEVPPEKTKGK